MPMNGANLGLSSESGPSMMSYLPSAERLAADERLQLGQLRAWSRMEFGVA